VGDGGEGGAENLEVYENATLTNSTGRRIRTGEICYIVVGTLRLAPEDYIYIFLGECTHIWF